MHVLLNDLAKHKPAMPGQNGEPLRTWQLNIDVTAAPYKYCSIQVHECLLEISRGLWWYFSIILAGCSDNQYQCANGFCVGFGALCDSFDDCGDRSDETAPGCGEKQQGLMQWV